MVVTPDTKNFGFLCSANKILALLVGEMSDIDMPTAAVSLSLLLACFPASVRTTWRVKVNAVLRDMSDPVLTLPVPLAMNQSTSDLWQKLSTSECSEEVKISCQTLISKLYAQNFSRFRFYNCCGHVLFFLNGAICVCVSAEQPPESPL